MFHDTVTLFCRFGPPRAEAFSMQVLTGVRFDKAAGANTRAGMAKIADRAILYIPFSRAKGYVSPEAWQILDSENRAGCWTLCPGDIVLAGRITAGEKSPAAILAEAANRFVITTVDEKNAESALAHFAVGCGRIFRQNGGIS